MSTLILWCCLTMLSAPPAVTMHPFTLGDAGAVLLPIQIGEHGPFLFALDTGSTRTLVTTRAATRAGLVANGSDALVSPGGEGTLVTAALTGLRLPDGRRVSVRPGIVASLPVRGRHVVDGLLGQDVLATLVYTIDYRRRQIEWGAQAPRVAGRRLPLSVGSHGVLVTLSQRPDGRVVRLVPDSGASGVVLFTPTDHVLSLIPGATALLRTVSGPRVVRRVTLEVLHVGDLRLANLDAVWAPAASRHAALGDGLLPLHLFERVTLNGPSGYLVAEGQRVH